MLVGFAKRAASVLRQPAGGTLGVGEVSVLHGMDIQAVEKLRRRPGKFVYTDQHGFKQGPGVVYDIGDLAVAPQVEYPVVPQGGVEHRHRGLDDCHRPRRIGFAKTDRATH